MLLELNETLARFKKIAMAGFLGTTIVLTASCTDNLPNPSTPTNGVVQSDSEDKDENVSDDQPQDVEASSNLGFRVAAILNSNPFSVGQCTWYAWKRANEKLGIKIQFTQNYSRHGKNWDNYVIGFDRGTEPRVNSVGVMEGGKWGHVYFVEEEKNGKFLISESNWAKPNKVSWRWISRANLMKRGSYRTVQFIYL